VSYTALKLLISAILAVKCYFNLFFQLHSLVQTHLYPCFVSHLCSHSNLPGPLTDGNAGTDNLVSELALSLPIKTATPIEAALLIYALYHQNASALHRQFHLTREQAQQIIMSMPLHTLVRPLSMSSFIVWLCGIEDMFVFFLKMQNTQSGCHCSLSSFMDPLVPKMRRLRLEDSPRDRTLLKLIPPPTRGRSRDSHRKTDMGQ
jgi:hypothetical protein